MIMLKELNCFNLFFGGRGRGREGISFKLEWPYAYLPYAKFYVISCYKFLFLNKAKKFMSLQVLKTSLQDSSPSMGIL